MKKIIVSIFALALTISVNAAETYRVTRVVDGDTVDLESLGRVRLIGVDTPETVHPFKPVEYFGIEASNFTKKLLEGKLVSIEYEYNRRDRYGRLLGYIYTDDGTLVNAKVIEEGYGFAYTKYPFGKMESFRGYERKARETNKGLWNKERASQYSRVQSKCQRKTCGQIPTCEEALHLLKSCGFSGLDRDRDGIPCEALCKRQNNMKLLTF